MKLTKEQLKILSGYFADMSKIIAVSTVLNFFVPSDIAAPVPIITAVAGASLTLLTLIFSLYLIR